jgi:hypothetical protein
MVPLVGDRKLMQQPDQFRLPRCPGLAQDRTQLGPERGNPDAPLLGQAFQAHPVGKLHREGRFRLRQSEPVN